MLTELQKKAAQAIVNVFETGRPQGKYGKVTLISGDAGHLTYGRSQTTLASGNLHLLIKAYCETEGAQYGTELSDYLERLANRDTGLDTDMRLRTLLREAGEDPIMQAVQDAFFDRVYFVPSVQSASAIGVSTALGTAVVYDSHVHGSWWFVRDRTNARHGLAEDVGEPTWIGFYVEERRAWLANHERVDLRATVYRMEAFRQLIDGANWVLALPFRVRGALIDEDALLGARPIRASAEEEGVRTLRLTAPPMQGKDVRAVQQALADAGVAVDVDGVFDARTDAAVRAFQQPRGLRVDGIVGPATRSALGL
jgi:chitosanase